MVKDPIASHGHNETNDHDEAQTEVFISGILLHSRLRKGTNILLLALLFTFILQIGKESF